MNDEFLHSPKDSAGSAAVDRQRVDVRKERAHVSGSKTGHTQIIVAENNYKWY
jgi:hypothetical protein